MEKAVLTFFDKSVDRFTTLNARLLAQSPEKRLKLTDERLLMLETRSKTAFLRYIDRIERDLAEKAAKLDSLSPLKVLSRGYSLVYNEEKLISSSESLENGDIIRIIFGNGGADAEIKDKW